MLLYEVRHELDLFFLEEAQAGCVRNEQEYVVAVARRRSMDALLSQLQGEVDRLKQEMSTLGHLAKVALVGKARAILDMRELVFLEIDTTGVNTHDEVCRVLVRSGGDVLEDIFIRPGVDLSHGAAHANGLTSKDLEGAISFVDAHARIVSSLKGRYIVSYGMGFDQKMLSLTCEKYNCSNIVLVGFDLQEFACTYWSQSALKLETVARMAGYLMPDKPRQTAEHRSLAQYLVLSAMANGVYDVSSMFADEGDALGDLDRHPF